MILETIGIIALAAIAAIALRKIYRWIFPYTPSNCPNNHDEMSRHGSIGAKCNICGEEL